MKRISVYVVDLSTEANPRKYLYFQWIDPNTGKRRSQSSKCKTRRDAERAAKDFEDDLNSMQPTGDGLIDWADFVTIYTEEHLLSLGDATARRVLSAFSVFSKVASPSQLSSISASMLSKYAAALRGDPWNRSESTIALHFQKIGTALRWAVEKGYLRSSPRIPKVARARTKKAKGRPLTDAEFVQMLRAVSGVVGRKAAKSWRRLLGGRWLSGLRLDEALHLSWWDGASHESELWVDTSGKYPLLGICAETEKGKQDRLLPITPYFGRWLLRTPPHLRVGRVFPLVKQRHSDTIRMQHVSSVICEIGEASGVKVNSTGKFCSAHDLRRTFGLRWAHKMWPIELQQLMRHADISTTTAYYAMIEATSFAERLWKADTTVTTTPGQN